MIPDQANEPRLAEQAGRRPDVAVVGGAGHVGLPLAIVFAGKGVHALVYDINQSALETIRAGRVPFMEQGAEPLLRRVLQHGLLSFSSQPQALVRVPTVIVTIATGVDEFLNPDTRSLKAWVDQCLPYLSEDQLIVLRSTVSPGTTQWLDKYLRSLGKKMKIAYCPERIVQGFAIEELERIPQIVSGTTPQAEQAATELFQTITADIVHLTPAEAEFGKLFCNAYRYIQFAAANQFYKLTSAAGVDYCRILEGIKRNYPRLRDLPSAGFAAGPCLFKDTMQLAAFAQNEFPLGHAAMLVNEGLVLHLVSQMERKYRLDEMTVGLLGMAFKANSDDTRSALSYKLKKVLSLRARSVLTTDPHVTMDRELLPLDVVLDRSDLLILCVPHSAFKNLDTKGKHVVDIWGFLGNGSLI